MEMEQKNVSFYSEGYRLSGTVFYPDNLIANQRRAGIVLCHGYTGVKDLYLPDHAARLAAAGYLAFIFDYKGWGESDGLPYSVHRDDSHHGWKGACNRLVPHSRVSDLQAAITFLSAQRQVDENKIGLYGTSYGGSTAIWTAAIDPRVNCIVSLAGVGNGRRWMSRVRRPYEWLELLERSKIDRTERALRGCSQYVSRDEILLPDPASQELANSTRGSVKGAVNQIPLEYVDDTLAFNPEWVVDKISPRPILFITSDNDLLVLAEESEELYQRAKEPKKLVILKRYSHFDLYLQPALDEVMLHTTEWFGRWMPARGE